MRAISLLLSVCLLLAPLLGVIAAPVPLPAPNIVAVSHHPDSAHHPQTSLAHLPVTAHAVPNKDGHVLGHMPVHPDHKNNMTPQQLHDYAHHINAHLGGNHIVYAAHKQGDDHVHFHAIHQDKEDAMFHPDHAIHHPSHDQSQAPHLGLGFAGHGKILVGLDRDRHSGNVHGEYVRHSDGSQGLVGTMPVRPDLQEERTSAHLHSHTQWLDQHLAGTQEGKSMVHVTHREGSPSANFHITGLHGDVAPVRPLTPDHPPHQSIAPLHPQEHGALTHHLQSTHQKGLHEYARVPNGSSSFKGTIPAHQTGAMTPAHLDEYAKHAYNHLSKMDGVDPNNLVVAAVHKPGDDKVHIHTAPRGRDMFERGTGQNQNAFPQFNQALKAAGHHLPGQPDVLAHHAELGALGESLLSKGATPATFADHISGHIIGVHGKHGGDPITQPCNNCHNTLAQFPVDYRGRDRVLHPGIKRAWPEE